MTCLDGGKTPSETTFDYFRGRLFSVGSVLNNGDALNLGWHNVLGKRTTAHFQIGQYSLVDSTFHS